MMDYDSFVETVKYSVQSYIDEESNLEGYTAKFTNVPKVNGEREAILLEKSEGDLTPALYFDNLYENYVRSGDIKVTLSSIISSVAQDLTEYSEVSPFESIDFTDKSRIFFQLINTESNQGLLNSCPHTDFNDLSLIYRYYVSDIDGMTSSILITNDNMKAFKVDKDELYDLAYRNTKELFPPKLMSMRDVLVELMRADGTPDEMIDMMFPTDAPEMYVISNDKQFNGAVSVLYTDELSKLADEKECDFAILPSSVHEVIAVPVAINSLSVEEMADMVHTINMGVVSEKDRLSNQVYLYDRKAQEIRLASDSPFKSISNESSEISRNMSL